MALLNNIASTRRNFSPLSLAPALWLSDTGSDPAQWDDISGNNRHATQATAANQPEIVSNARNGRQVRRFNGSKWMDTVGFELSSSSVFSVVKLTSTPAGAASVFCMGSTTTNARDALLYLNSSNQTAIQRSNGTTYPTAVTSGNLNEFRIIGGTYNQTNLIAYNNGVAGLPISASPSITTNRSGAIGATRQSPSNNDFRITGDIAEILVFSTALSPQDRRKVEQYLSNKWAITIPTVDEFYVQSLAPALWLDASDPNTLFDAVAGGNLVGADGTVARWEDKSGNGRHATQSTLANQPLRKINVQNSRDGILYNGTDDFLNLTNSLLTSIGSGDFEIITACRPVGSLATNYRAIFGATNDTPGFYYRDNIAFGFYSSGPKDFNSVLTQDIPYLLGFRRSSGVVSGIVNGKVEATTHTVTTSYSAAMYLGRESVSYFNQYHYEILVFPKALSQTERQNVQLYLANKWNIPVYDPDALNYFARITAAGSSITDQNKLAVDAFIKGCKADNNWFAIKACCLLAGADTLSGALVPLVGPIPTNTNFTEPDYSRINGLQGGPTLKYLTSNRSNASDPQNDCSLAIWVTNLPTNGATNPAVTSSTNQNGAGGRNIFAPTTVRYTSMCNNGGTNATTAHSTLMTLGFVGISRSEEARHLFRTGGVTNIVNKAVTAPEGSVIRIFGQGNRGDQFSNARISFYSIGNSINLERLDARLATYMSSLT